MLSWFNSVRNQTFTLNLLYLLDFKSPNLITANCWLWGVPLWEQGSGTKYFSETLLTFWTFLRVQGSGSRDIYFAQAAAVINKPTLLHMTHNYTAKINTLMDELIDWKWIGNKDECLTWEMIHLTIDCILKQ